MLVISNLCRSLVIFIIHIRTVKNRDTFGKCVIITHLTKNLFHCFTLHNNFLLLSRISLTKFKKKKRRNTIYFNIAFFDDYFTIMICIIFIMIQILLYDHSIPFFKNKNIFDNVS